MTEITLAKSDQLNADDLIGRSLTIKITDRKLVKTADQPLTLSFEGDNGKPYKPGKSMRRVMKIVWGPDSKAYIGKSMTLIRDQSVKWAGMEVGGIRISHMSDMAKEKIVISLTMSKANKKPYTVKRMVTEVKNDKRKDELKLKGEEMSSQGTVEFVKWGKSLDPNDRGLIKEFIEGWTSDAKSADELLVSDDV